MAATTTSAHAGEVTIREVVPEDAEACARICFEAFGAIHDHHRFPRDFPVLEAAAGLMSAWIPHPSVWGVVAERDGRDRRLQLPRRARPDPGRRADHGRPRGPERGRRAQADGGRARARQGAPGIRLLQDGFHMRSLSLYTSLGFDVKEPVVVVSGKPLERPGGGRRGSGARGGRPGRVRGALQAGPRLRAHERASRCACRRSSRSSRCGTDASRRMRLASSSGRWTTALRRARRTCRRCCWGRRRRSTSRSRSWRLCAQGSSAGPWKQGLRSVKPMNLMALGSYQEPSGSWFPSVLY